MGSNKQVLGAVIIVTIIIIIIMTFYYNCWLNMIVLPNWPGTISSLFSLSPQCLTVLNTYEELSNLIVEWLCFGGPDDNSGCWGSLMSRAWVT